MAPKGFQLPTTIKMSIRIVLNTHCIILVVRMAYVASNMNVIHVNVLLGLGDSYEKYFRESFLLSCPIKVVSAESIC